MLEPQAGSVQYRYKFEAIEDDPEPDMSLLNPATSTTAAADARINPRHPFVGHLHLVDALDRKQPHRTWTPEDGALPSLYISHGAPPLFEDAAWMEQLVNWARSMPKPKAILIVSAHWESEALAISSTAPTELVYDFGGLTAPTSRCGSTRRRRPAWPGRSCRSCPTRRPPTSTAAAGWTTAPGCR